METPIWAPAADLSATGAARRLWKTLIAHHDMGETTTSKLMAAKRPHLIPVQDSVVTAALMGDDTRRYKWWMPWRDRLQGTEGETLQRAARSLVEDVPEADHLSVLRLLDVAIWMRHRGWKSVTSLSDFGVARPVG